MAQKRNPTKDENRKQQPTVSAAGASASGGEDDAEQRLRRQLNFTRAITDSLGEGVYALDCDGRVTFMNPAAERMLGWTQEELLGMNMHDAIHFQREDGTRVAAEECPLLAVVKLKASYGTEYDVFTRRDGRVFPVSYTSSPIVTDGEVTGAVLAFRDISSRREIEAEIREQKETVETVNRVGRMLAAELDLQKVVQAVTDAATELIGAQFGSFFYNVLDGHGGSYMLYTLSGVPREAFAHFPMPRATDIFSPTFRGEGVLRLDDVKLDPRYGKNSPYFGMPEGHLPVTSYLAVPVVSRTDEVIGGLFFGHPETGVFTERHEQLVTGLAAQASVAVDNARLFEARKRAEEVLLERARLAVLAAEVGTALTQRDTLPEMLNSCAEALVKHLDAAFARIWTLNETEGVLELQASAGMYTHLDGGHSRVPVGKFKIGLIAEERMAHLTNDVANDQRVGDKEWAAREGMVAFAGYPLILEDRLVGVMAMFARHALTDVTLQSMASVASGIAVGIERKQAEAELKASEGRYRALTDAMPQLVWATDERGSHFYFNQRWYEYTGLTEEESLGFGFTNALHPEDKERTLRSWERAWRAGEGYDIEYRFYSRPQAQYRWFLGRATPVRDESGRVTQWVGTCTDIEDQKQMEETLARLNEERERMLEEVSTPLVPVWKGVLVLPIIGSLDTLRMERAMKAALDEVTRTGARACIIDITGARIIDSHAVANLSNLISALALVGAEGIVTGIGAHAAQSLVGLGLDLQGMRTYRTLAQALEALIKNGYTAGRIR
jgi:PAS domain S-box-containing protein